MDQIAEALRQTRAVRVQIRLTESEVLSGFPETGFWPRVTLERPGKSKTVPLTDWGKLKQQKAEKNELSPLEKAILNFAGGTVNTPLHKCGRRQALAEVVDRVKYVIKRAIAKAATRGNTYERHTAAQRRQRKNKFLDKFREFCEREGRGIEYEDIRPSELGRVWDDVRRTKVASFVMDS